jgi:hypothetical protein
VSGELVSDVEDFSQRNWCPTRKVAFVSETGRQRCRGLVGRTVGSDVRGLVGDVEGLVGRLVSPPVNSGDGE